MWMAGATSGAFRSRSNSGTVHRSILMNKVAITLALAVFIPIGVSEIAPRAAGASEST